MKFPVFECVWSDGRTAFHIRPCDTVESFTKHLQYRTNIIGRN